MPFVLFAGMRSERSHTMVIPCWRRRKADRTAERIRAAHGFGFVFTPELRLPATPLAEQGPGVTYCNVGRVPWLTWLSLAVVSDLPSGLVPEAAWLATPVGQPWHVPPQGTAN